MPGQMKQQHFLVADPAMKYPDVSLVSFDGS